MTLGGDTIEDIRFTNLSYNINLIQEANCNIWGDKDRIGQVIINLINNGIKYSPAKQPIEVRIHQPEKNRVAVSIKDYGIGIDKKDQERIFERFYRVEGQNENKFAGFGIGLFIADQIIKRHFGFMTIESEKGEGSVFTFTLPSIITFN
jgi:signal transduction histidine kinase